MKRNLFALKNLIWLIGIGLSLAAMFVALVLAAISPYSGPIERGGPILGQERKKTGETEALSGPVQTANGELTVLGETADGGLSYLDSLTFLVDSTAIGLRDYHIPEELGSTAQIWGSRTGDIPASSLDAIQIEYTDGSLLSPADAAMIRHPARLVICVGSDGLVGVEEETFVSGYRTLVQSIQRSSPQTVIICCSLSSVATSYNGASGLSPSTLREANGWIQRVCADTGAYYADTASAVNDNSGWLLGDYASVNGKTLNSSGLKEILNYLRTHTAP